MEGRCRRRFFFRGARGERNTAPGDLLLGNLTNGDGDDRSGGVAVTGGLEGEEDLNQVGSDHSVAPDRPGGVVGG